MNEMSKPETPATTSEDEVSRLVTAARDALTDQMIERMAITGGTALELVDRLNDEETNDAVHKVLDRLTEMNKAGALDTACDMVMVVHAMRNALTDAMVERLFIYVENIMNTIATDEVLGLVETACSSLGEAAAESEKAPASGGIMGAVRLLSSAETQNNLNFLLQFSKKLKEHASQDGATCKK